ncbi:hypothetical protein HDU97_006327 [Phlyctochytrium planicorne]|nr:hypothetical protein HDU97_006327 [Phlyctochytrium planicorne]
MQNAHAPGSFPRVPFDKLFCEGRKVQDGGGVLSFVTKTKKVNIEGVNEPFTIEEFKDLRIYCGDNSSEMQFLEIVGFGTEIVGEEKKPIHLCVASNSMKRNLEKIEHLETYLHDVKFNHERYSTLYKTFQLESIGAPPPKLTYKTADSIDIVSPHSKRLKTTHEAIVLTYPAVGRNSVTLRDEDLERLEEGEFLNDNIIEFFLKYLSLYLCADKAEDFHIYSTFFFQQLRAKGSGKGDRNAIAYEKVQRGTKDIDIFQKKYLLIPINENLHWYLAIVKDPCKLLEEKPEPHPAQLFIFDSLDRKHSEVKVILTEYLRSEAQAKLGKPVKSSLENHYAKVRKQENHFDCGIHILHYAHTLLRNPDRVSELAMKKESMSVDEFGSLEEFRNGRYFLKNLITSLRKN